MATELGSSFESSPAADSAPEQASPASAPEATPPSEQTADGATAEPEQPQDGEQPAEQEQSHEQTETQAPQAAQPMTQEQMFAAFQRMNQEQQAPIIEFFKRAQAAAEEAKAARAAQAEQAKRQAELKRKFEIREAMRPRAPDPSTATAEMLSKYAYDLAMYESRIAKEDAIDEVRMEVEALRAENAKIVEQLQNSALEEQSERNLSFIKSTISSYASDSRFPFMKSENGQKAFLETWYAMNNAAGKTVDPSEAMKRLVSYSAMLNSGPDAAREAAKRMDANRRDEQGKLGAPAAPKIGRSNPPNAKPDQGLDLTKKWWENGLNIG